MSKMLPEDTYQTIASDSKGSYRIKGSRFIALARPVWTEEEVKRKLSEIRREYFDAHHHCYAYRLGYDKSVFRINDDGEPSGAAGKPIFGQIQSKDLTNILVVVVRYFGGTKLGIPGLINAYKAAARESLEAATIITRTINNLYGLAFEYPLLNDVMRVIRDENADIISQDFNENCKLIFSIRKNASHKVFEKFNGMNKIFIEDKGMIQ